MWQKRNICRLCWDIWRPGDNPGTIGGVFGSTCEICGQRNHDDIFINADEREISNIKDIIERKKGTEQK